EVVGGRQIQRRIEGDVELDLLAGHGAVAAGGLVGQRVNAAGLDRVAGREAGGQGRGGEAEFPRGAIAKVEGDVGGRVDAGGHVDGAARVRVLGEDAVDFHDHLVDRGPAGDEPGEGGAGDLRLRRRDEVVGRFDLE